MTFSINLPKVLSKPISLKYLGISYDALFGLEIMMVVKILKWAGQ